jgi:uncharacterized protein YjbI with pentapeptide repeats
MKRQLLGIAAFSIVLNSAAVSAANPDQIRQLLQTNSCPGCDLTNADLRRLDLTEADLSGVNLSGADLSRANLARVNLSSANLAGVKLKGTNLMGANLANADLTNAINGDSCSSDLDLEFYGFRVSDDSSFCIPDAIELSEIVGMDFCSALGVDNESTFCNNLVYIELNLLRRERSRTSARGADLSGANLSGADLSGVDLRAATLTGTRLSDTNLSYALLLDAELPEASPATWDSAFVTAADIESFLGELIVAEVTRARESEGKNYVGAFNRAQQAYRLENSEFATTVEELQAGLPTETENYRIEIVPQPDPTRSVKITATARQDGIRSYTGAVFVLENGVTYAILCETDEPSQRPPEMLAPPTSENDRPLCPAGSSTL